MEDGSRNVAERIDQIDALLHSVARRDREAFRLLYDMTSDMIFGICARMLRRRDEAEDLAQEVYVLIWQKAGSFDSSKASAFGWMASVARNRAIDRLRRVSASETPGYQGRVDEAQVTEPSPARLHEFDEERAQLDDCVGGLDERGRSLITSAFYEGLTYQELADRTGNPLGSVKTWIRRGLAQLRECLKP